MSDKQKLILQTVAKVLPDLSENEADKLLAFSEGFAMFKEREKDTAAQKTADSSCPKQ